MGWTMTTFEQTDEGMVVTEHYTPHVTEGKRGTYDVPFNDSECFITVYDNTAAGIDAETAKAIAEHAWTSTIYWSDDRLCHWMFDFKVRGHWCEGLFPNNGRPADEQFCWNHIYINVYD